MDKIQSSLFEAMKQFSDYASKNASSTLTIECDIIEMVDEGQGLYKVGYLGNEFTVHSTNANITYAVGEKVYVLVPEGDFTKDKVIFGSTSPSAAQYVSENDSTAYHIVSDNLIDIDLGIIKMSSYEEFYSAETEVITGVNEKKLLGDILGRYLNDYRTVVLSFAAQTSLNVDQQVGGNYGVTIGIPVIVDKVVVPGEEPQRIADMKYYILDVGNMLGNPYRFTAWAPQKLYITLDDQYEYDTSRVPVFSYFCYGFSLDADKVDIKDVWLKDISINIADVLTEQEKVGYNLTLKATEGEYYAENYRGTKTLTPELKVNNKTTSFSNCPVYWFREDASIKNDSKFYSPYGGFGWKCLNEKTDISKADDGTEVFTYITSAATLEVPASDVESFTRYKCTVVYDENAVSAIIVLKNLQSSKLIELNSTSGSSVFVKDIGYVDLTATVYAAGDTEVYTAAEKYQNSIVYSWARYDKNGNLLPDEDDFFEVVDYNKMVNKEFGGLLRDCFETRIKFPVNMVEDYNLLYCSAYLVLEDGGKIKKTLIGTRSYAITTSREFSYMLTVNNGSKIFKYDSDGDSPMGEAYDGPAESKVTHVDALTFNLYKLDGTELTDEEYYYCKYTWFIPVNSMIEVDDKFLVCEDVVDEKGNTESVPVQKDGFYTSTGWGRGDGLPYSIAKRFNASKNNNSIVLRVEFDGSSVENTVPISFIKEGDSGTNGTAFAAVLAAGRLPESAVTYGTRNAKGVAQKLKFLYNTTTKTWYYHDIEKNTRAEWNSRPRIFTRVYYNGELLKYGTDYSVNYSMFDAKTTNACFEVLNVDSTTGGMMLGVKSGIVMDSSEVYVNIVQAEIKVLKGNAGSITNANQVIYAYYPIELTMCSFNSDIIPSLDGGFAHVLYASDGTNPAWDETDDFTCNDAALVDKDLGEYFQIDWTAQNHLNPSAAADAGTFHTEPVNKYDDGNSKNYVMAKLVFGEDKVSDLNGEIADLNADIQDCEALAAAANENIKQLKAFAKAYTIKEWLEYIDDLQEFFDKRTNSVYRLNTLLETSLVNLDNYLNLQENYNKADIKKQCQDLWDKLGDLKEQCTKAIEQIEKLNAETGYTFDDLISLEGEEIEWNDELKQHLTDSLGLDVALTLQLSIQDVNTQIADYNSSLKKLKALKDKVFEQDENGNDITYLDAYANIRKEAEDACGKITDNAYAKYVDMRDKVLCYLGEFDSITSITDVKELFDNIYENILKPVYTMADGDLVFKTSVEDAAAAYTAELAEQVADDKSQISALNKILATKSKTIIHIKPIVFAFNTYEMSNINGWDGNKLEMGDGTYLLAPQVGAGTKDSRTNKFTGIVMGIKTLDTSSSVIQNSKQVGLFGYADGVRSLFLNADNGSAMFGRADKGGQIIVDPNANRAYLYSSNFFKSYNQQTGLPSNYGISNWKKEGLLLDLTTPQIIFGNGNFQVDENGHLTAKGGGTIAGWKISDTKLTSSDNKTTFYSGGGDDAERINVGNGQFIVYGDGSFKASNGKFKVNRDGEITATGGTVGGWNISDTKISSNGTVLSQGGKIECKNLVANTEGTIGGWQISASELKGSGITLGNGSLFGSGWSLSPSGLDLDGTIQLGGTGQIGGCAMKNGVLTVDNAHISTLFINKLCDTNGNNLRANWGGLTYSSIIGAKTIGVPTSWSANFSLEADKESGKVSGSINLVPANTQTLIGGTSVGTYTTTFLHGTTSKGQ